MKKLIEKLKAKKIAMGISISMLVMSICAVCACAEGEGGAVAPNVTGAVTTALQQTSNDALSIIASVLPYALAIVGAVLVVTIGVRVFKKISGR